MLHPDITLRFGFPDDERALAELAALDSSEPPPHPLLVAEVGDELRAALSLRTGASIADPFHPTEPLLELLRARSRQLKGETGLIAASSRALSRLSSPGRLRTSARP